MIGRRAMIQGALAAPLAATLPRPVFATATDRFDPAAAVSQLASATRTDYHDPRLAGAIADRLMANLKAGAYAVGTPDALAALLNRDIAAVANDAHFVIMAGSMADMGPPVPPTEPHQRTEPLNARELNYLRRLNFGVATAEILPKNIGRIAIHQFYRPTAEVKHRYALAMGLLADTDALIVDLTRCIGGDPNSVALLISYFFDRPSFILNRFRWRKLPVQEFRTTREPGGPLYGEQRPVAVLMAADSYSAAEEFAYDMQVLRRGIIVGAKSPGAANHALPVAVPGLTAFIPQARAENPVTGTNWEGKGITPDVPANPPTVEAAQRALLERLATPVGQSAFRT